MENSLIIMQNRLEALLAFCAKYQPDAWQCNVSAINATSIPEVTFFPQFDVEVKQWAESLFGRTGWVNTHVSDGWQNVTKEVDGVRVTLFRAHQIEEEKAGAKPADPVLIFGQPSEVAA